MKPGTVERRSIEGVAPARALRAGRLTALLAMLLVLALAGCKSSSDSADSSSTPSTAPATPSNVAATAGNTQVTLTWDAVSGAASYSVYFATSSGVTTANGTRLTAAGSPYTHTGLTNGTTYHYVVVAVNAAGQSSPSPEVSATPAGTPTVTGCADDSAAYPIDDTTTYSTTTLSTPAAVNTTAGQVSTLSFTLPTSAVSLGIAVVAPSASLYSFIEHGLIINSTNTYCMTGPNGNVPISFNQVDENSDGSYDDSTGSLVNTQAVALAFPNNGEKRVLPPGTYTFPIGAVQVGGQNLVATTLQPYVYYKAQTATKPTLKVNVLVASGVRAGLTTASAASTDPEIQGAVGVLQSVYETDPDASFNLTFNYIIVPSSYVTIDSETEFQTLLQSYPASPTHDAINLFVVGTLGPNFVPDGVLGFAAGIPGPFTRQGTAASGVIAEYQNDSDGRFLGFIFTHELGHYLGLFHTSQTNTSQNGIIGVDPIADTPECTNAEIGTAGGVDNCPDVTNLMFPIAPATVPYPTPVLSTDQGTVLRLNPAVTP